MNISTPAIKSSGARFPAVMVVLSLLVMAFLVSLGMWQIRRLHWKLGLLSTIHERMATPPKSLPEIERQFAVTHDVEYQPVTVSGNFLNSGERHFLATWQGDSGFDVYTPLRLGDGSFLFVNRGFVPYSLKDPALRPLGEPKGRVTITGLARNPLAKKPSRLVPDNTPSENIFYWKDLKVMAATAGLGPGARVLPFFVDANAAPNPGGLPVGGVTLIDLPNNHFQYALTWFGLATGLAAVMLARLVTWWRQDRHAAA